MKEGEGGGGGEEVGDDRGKGNLSLLYHFITPCPPSITPFYYLSLSAAAQ